MFMGCSISSRASEEMGGKKKRERDEMPVSILAFGRNFHVVPGCREGALWQILAFSVS